MLGGAKAEIDTVSDMNNLVANGVFKITVQETTLNIPYTTAQTLYLKVETCMGNRLVQTITSYNDHSTWRRTRQNNNTWDAWQRLDNFGCTTAADLASLLGERGDGNDMDNKIVPGAYFINSSSGAGFPSGAYKWGVLLVFTAYSQELTAVQIYLANNSITYFRTKYWGSEWNHWKKITGTDL